MTNKHRLYEGTRISQDVKQSTHHCWKLASLCSPSKTKCNAIHLSDYRATVTVKQQFRPTKEKRQKNDAMQILPKSWTWTIKCKLLYHFYCVLTFTQEMLHRELSKIKLNNRLIHLSNSPQRPKNPNHHNLKQFMITCQKTLNKKRKPKTESGNELTLGRKPK